MTVRYEAELNATAVLLVYTGNIATGRGIEQTLQNLAELEQNAQDQRDIHLEVVRQNWTAC